MRNSDAEPDGGSSLGGMSKTAMEVGEEGRGRKAKVGLNSYLFPGAYSFAWSINAGVVDVG